MVRNLYKSQLSRLSALESAHASCASKLKVAQEAAVANSKARKEVQQELKDFVQKVKVMEGEMLVKSQEAVTQQAMRTRVEVMYEYFRGEHVAWDLNEATRIYNEVYPQDALSLFVPRDEVFAEPPDVEKVNVSGGRGSKDVEDEGDTLDDAVVDKVDGGDEDKIE